MVFAASGFTEEAKDGKECPSPTPLVPSANLQQMKSLAGLWQGTVKHSTGPDMPLKVEYKVTSGGTAVTEMMSPGTSHEMLSVYHDNAGKLAMTHYCMLGNQPELVLESAERGKFSFVSSEQTKKSLAGTMYMGSVTLEQPDKDTLVQTWGGVNPDGSSSDATVISLKRS